jgi:hypothetical protein
MKLNTLAAVLLSAGLLAGCYSRQPLRTATPEPLTRIVATVTDTGAVLMGNAVGPGAVEVEALVRSATPDEWGLHLIRLEHRDGRQVTWNRELVTFPRAALSNVQVVELDRTRSWIAAGGIVVGAILAARAFGLIFGGDDEGRDPPGGPPPVELIGGGRR